MRTSTFTSFINVEPDKAIDQKFANLERQAQQTFNKIAAAASKANTAMAGAKPGAGMLGGGNATATAAQARALRDVAQANQRVSTEVAKTSQRMGENALATARARREMTGFERTLRTTATTLNVVQGPLGPIAGRVGALASAVGELTGLRLGLAGTGAALFALTAQANKYTEVRSKLVPLFEAQTDVNKAMRETVRIAEESRTGLAPVVDLYSRLTLAGRDYGISQQRVARLTEIASKAAKLSGGAQVSQDAGLYQFAQGIGSGTLAGDELKSIRENTLRLAKAIADGMGVTIGELKKLGAEGKLTPKVIADALEKESARIDAEISRLPETLASASSKFSNALTIMVGEQDQALGFTTALAEGLAFLAANLNEVTNLTIGLATAFAIFKGGTYVRDVIQRAEATRQTRLETIAATRAEVQAASQQRTAAAQRITQLRSVRAELQQQLVAERNVRNEATAAARTAVTTNQRRAGLGFAESAIATRQYAAAMETARRASANLENTQNRLRAVSGELSQATGVMTTSTSRYRTATTAAAAASRSFASRIGGLVAAINPLGIALSIGISFLIQFAFRQDAAGEAADRMAAREANLGRFIDLNTGKIIEQNKALIANERLKAREEAADALSGFSERRQRLRAYGSEAGILGLGSQGKDLSPEQRAAIRAFTGAPGANALPKISSSELAKRLEAGRGQSKGRDAAIDRALGYLSDTVTTARDYGSATATERLLGGKPRPGDLRRAQGYVDPTGADIAGGAAGGGADEKKAKGRDKLKKATDGAAKAERELQQAIDRTDKIQDIVGRYGEQDKGLVRAERDKRELDQLVGKAIELRDALGNAIGKGIYTQEMADADSRRIDYGVRKPIRDLLRDQERMLGLGELRVQGYEEEAAALEKALQIQDDIGEVTRAEYQQILNNERAQLRINDALEARGRITSLILGQAQEARDIIEGVLLGDTSIVGGIKQAMNNIARIEVRKFTEQLFAGADEKVRELLRGQSGVDAAVSVLEKQATRGGTAVGDHATAVERATARIDAATGGGKLVGAPTSGAAATSPAAIANTLKTATAKGSATGVASAISSIRKGADGFSFLGGFGGFNSANDNESYDPNAEIVVTATKAVSMAQKAKSGGLPTGAEVYNKIGESVGSKLDKVLGTKFMKGIGSQVGTALQGAGTGMMASSFAKALGIKQSKTGAAIGGAIGNFLPIPGGAIIGGLIGGTLGGLVKKTPRGSATIGAGADGGLAISSTQGNSKAAIKAGSGAADATISSLTQVAKQLGGTVNAAMGSVSIGKSGDSWHVDPTGRGRLKKSQGGIDFDDDYEAAVAFAMQTLIKQGVINGISQASQNILASGKDLQASIEKASLIESIPKRLMALQDPVRYAVTELNREFAEMIAALKEGGATAGQFADAQKLYDLERARAIEAATAQSTAAIQAYLDEMVGGQSSPLNKQTVYGNASSKFGSTVADFKAGKADQNELLTAAKNFQDASRSLFGSGANFFTDFDAIRAALTGAKGSVGTGADLPGSPFATDTAVQNAINSLNGTTAEQTNVLNGTLQQILAALSANDNGGYGGSSLNLLPGVGGGGGGYGERQYNKAL